MLKPVVLTVAEQLSKSDPRLFGLPAGSLFASNIGIQKFGDRRVVRVWDAHGQGWRQWLEMAPERKGLAAAPSSAPTTSSGAVVGRKRGRDGGAEEKQTVSKKAKTAGQALAKPVLGGKKRGASEAEVDIEEEKVAKRVRFLL